MKMIRADCVFPEREKGLQCLKPDDKFIAPAISHASPHATLDCVFTSLYRRPVAWSIFNLAGWWKISWGGAWNWGVGCSFGRGADRVLQGRFSNISS